MTRTLKDIAKDIRSNWAEPSFEAQPYLAALECLDDVSDYFGLDTGRAIIGYFLAHAGAFNGPHAHRLKAELRHLLGAVSVKGEASVS